MAAKLVNLRERGQYTSGCYDPCVFNKFNSILGGKVRNIMTASAPISGDVLEFLKVVFCCPVLEAYGMSETAGATTSSKPEDPVCGHIGGPI